MFSPGKSFGYYVAMNLPRFANSLFVRLLFFGVLMVVVGATVRYILLSRYLREDLVQVVSGQQAALAEAFAREVDYKIAERRRLLERLALVLPPALLQESDRLRDWLQTHHQLQPLFSLGLMVADRQGRILTDFPVVAGRRGMSVAGSPYAPIVLAGHSVIGSPLLGQVTKRPVLPMAAPVRDASGHTLAVLIGITALDAPDFLDRLQQERIGQSGGFLLVSPQDKLFVAASDPSMVLKPVPPAGVNPLHDRAMNGYRGSGVTANAKGVEEISAMASVPSTGWFVVARIPTSEALASVSRAQGYVIRHTFTAIFIVLFVAGFIISWLLRPLYRAAALAGRMTDGELPLAPLPVERDDEVGHLTVAFNKLLAKLVNSQRELERMAHHDSLTGLPNRSLLADRMKQALARAQRNGNQVGLLFLDLDDFKPINDSLGHDAGDEALREIARRLQSVIRQSDTLARVGGDEFVLLVADLELPAEEGLRSLAGKCLDAVAKPLLLNDTECGVGVSIGIALGGGGCSPNTLLEAADKAMYEAKQRGRGCYVMAPFCDSRAATTGD